MAFLWLGLGLLFLPGARATDAKTERRALSVRSLQVIAATATGLATMLVVGASAGLVVGPLAAAAGWVGAGRLHARPARTRDDPALPFVLDLTAAALQAGQPVASALLLAAPAAGERSAAALTRVGRLLALGADPGEAWQIVSDEPALDEVAAAARRSATSGARLAAAFTQTATDLRAAAHSAAQARAHRAGALAAAPLGLCFLPAFVCLAIVPVVVGIASAALGAAH